MTETDADGKRRQFWIRVAIGLVLATAYVLVTSVAIRVVFLTEYDAMLKGLSALDPARLLRDGGIFAFLVRVLQSRLIERATDRMLPDHDPPSSDADAHPAPLSRGGLVDPNARSGRGGRA